MESGMLISTVLDVKTVMQMYELFGTFLEVNDGIVSATGFEYVDTNMFKDISSVEDKERVKIKLNSLFGILGGGVK